MKVLLCHNYYQQAGGEDGVFAAEASLLESHGHQVVRYERHNDEIKSMGQLAVARATIWNKSTYAALGEVIANEKPDVAHFHNTFPLISPAGYAAANDAGVPVVQTLHNYRLLCPGAQFFRQGRPCEDCMGRAFALPGVRHGCYRGSAKASLVVASMQGWHRLKGTWRKRVDAYIALTRFARDKYVQGGLPADKMHVKQNFTRKDPGPGQGEGGYAVFVGRLSEEKGLEVLVEAWSRLGGRIKLKIVGDGPLMGLSERKIEGVEWLGRQPSEKVYELIGGAMFMVFPSIWYEGMPLTIVECLAKGTPLVASKLGAMEEMIVDGVTGWHFDAGDPAALAGAVERAAAECRSGAVGAMRAAARADFLAKYTPESNYPLLMEIYQAAAARRAAITGRVRVGAV